MQGDKYLESRTRGQELMRGFPDRRGIYVSGRELVVRGSGNLGS